jgi:transglutaminase-like putative cysteine protease
MSTKYQQINHSRITIDPISYIYQYDDYWGTRVHYFETLEPHSALKIVSDSEVVCVNEAPQQVYNVPWDSLRGGTWQLSEALAQSSNCIPPGDLVELAQGVRGENLEPHQTALRICEKIRENVEYLPGTTNVTTTAEHAWIARSGVCQDISHICLAALRSVGIPARYVSGYLAPDETFEVGNVVLGESHAWVEWYTGGWYAYDPTNWIEASGRHIAVAKGRQYTDISPLKGVYAGAAETELQVEVAIERIA